MTVEKVKKLKALGLDSENDEEAFDDLIFLCWHLIEKNSRTEVQRFENELNRLITPTN